METAITTLSYLPSTAEQVEAFSNKLINEVESGYVNPLELKTKLKLIEKVILKVDKETKEAQLKELSKHGKECTFNGFKVERVEAGTKYNYDGCNDPILIDLESKLADLESEIENRKIFLKTLQKPTNVLIEADGVVETLYPPVKTSTTTLKLTAI